MNERLRGTVWFVALQLVFAAALIHLALGLWEWSRWARAGFLLPRDYRWPVFVASALVIFYGLHRSLRTENRDPYYLAGIVVMLGYAVGYFLWHLGGHPVLLIPGTGPGTEQIGIQWFLDHLFAGPVEFFAVAVEVGAAALLAVLYLTTPSRSGEAAGSTAAASGVSADDPADEQS